MTTRKKPKDGDAKVAVNDRSARLILGDCIEAMATMPDESIDAIVCDPPYGLEFMGKDWDSFRIDKRAARWAGSERTGGAGAGFGEIPGGAKLPAFGKRRTTALCRACGKRDAFRNPHACGDAADWVTIPVDHSPMEMRAFQNWVALWAVEALRILKPGGHLLSFGAPRTYHRLACGLEEAGFEIRDSLHYIYGSGFPKNLDVAKQIDKAAGAERAPAEHASRPGMAKSWDDGSGKGWNGESAVDGVPITAAAAAAWEGWGTALKPAHEPIVLARKSLAGTVAATVLMHGTGALNIDAARPSGEPGSRTVERPKGKAGGTTDFPPSATVRAEVEGGRWPANVVLSHLEGCEGSGASHTAVLCEDGCPVAELNAMSGESDSPAAHRIYERSTDGTKYASPYRKGDEVNVYGYGDGGGAARFFYIAKPRRRERVGGTIRNLHPTVKPIDLMRHLVKLVTPPEGTILDPFLGSGSTGCAAMVEGFSFVGIERDKQSFETAAARIGDYAFAHGRAKPTRV